jgi:hypothetical protein
MHFRILPAGECAVVTENVTPRYAEIGDRNHAKLDSRQH